MIAHRFFKIVLLIASLFQLPCAVAQNLNPKADSNGNGIPTRISAPEPEVSDGAFTIGPNDVLAVFVWKEPDVTRTLTVRADGKISLPLVGELQASGRTPKLLEVEIRDRLKSYIAEPEVTVMVQESRSRSFNILGEVARPGSYPIAKPVTVLDAIAIAGGFRDFAKRKSIYVLRTLPDGAQQRIPFNFSEATSGRKPEMNVLLQPRDTVVVP